MSKHKTVEEVFSCPTTELAALLGDLRYDELALLLNKLGTKIRNDAAQDRAQGRTRLAAQLETLSAQLTSAGLTTDRIWSICVPHMRA